MSEGSEEAASHDFARPQTPPSRGRPVFRRGRMDAMAKMSRLPPSLSRPLLDYMEGMTMAQTEVDELDRMVLPLLGNSAMKVQFEKEICINY